MIINNPRNLLWLIPLFLFLTSPLWKPAVSSFLAPRGGYDPSTVNITDSQSQSFRMDELTITMSNRGRVDWVINAERAFTERSDTVIGLVEVDALYTDKDQAQTHITSSRGRYTIDERHLILIDNVIIRKPSAQQEMFTDLLHYYDARKMIVSPGDMEIIGPDYAISAGRLDYDLANDGYDFSNRVIVQF